MGNLFLVFDPSIGIEYVSFNWVSFLAVIVYPSRFWLSERKCSVVFIKVSRILSGEIKINANLSLPSSSSLVLARVFFLVARSNFLGLLPYVFTATRHPAFTFVVAFSSWRGYVVYRRFSNPLNFFSHLVPDGTPKVLVPFIVLIELVRRLMRPLTLGIRLAANMVAGHLLLVLVRRPVPRTRWYIFRFVIVGVLTLTILEVGVAFIQGYVFISLSSLYTGEVNAPNL